MLSPSGSISQELAWAAPLAVSDWRSAHMHCTDRPQNGRRARIGVVDICLSPTQQLVTSPLDRPLLEYSLIAIAPIQNSYFWPSDSFRMWPSTERLLLACISPSICLRPSIQNSYFWPSDLLAAREARILQFRFISAACNVLDLTVALMVVSV